LVMALVLLVLTQTQALGDRRTSSPLVSSASNRQIPLQQAPLPPVTSIQEAADGLPDVTALLREALPRYHIELEEVPAFFRQQVHKRLSDYAESAHTDLQVMLQRAAPYLPSIKLLLKQQNLPSYFAYVPLVESAFQADAGRSESGARGLWQLVPETARAYGLRVSQHVDERLDPLRATRAASRYLRELQQTFGPNAPLLVLAAYNLGENNLSRAIVRARTRDIWSLMRQGQIPYHTRDFLAKMVALWVAITHAERFQLVLEAPQNPKAVIDGAFPRPASLRPGAHQGKPFVPEAPETESQEPAAQVLASSPSPGPATAAEAYIPVQVDARPAPALAVGSAVAQRGAAEACWYTVAAGDVLSAIAQPYALEPGRLKRLNQLDGAASGLHPGQRLTVCEALVPGTTCPPRRW
jgi:hypothetical protein